MMKNSPTILDQFGNQMSSASYRGAGNRHPVTANWHTSRKSPHSALKDSRESLSSRIHDLARNDGWGAAAVNRYQDELVGSGWRLSAKPNIKLLGITREQAEEFADAVESLWLDYTNDLGFWADAERSTTVNGMLGLAVRHQFADGECLGWLGYRENSPSYSTCLQVIDPVRLSNPHGKMDTANLRDGVELDEWGAEVKYHIRKGHPGDLAAYGNNYIWEDFDREMPCGRPVIIRLKEKKWAGMSRGVSLLAPVVTKLKQITQYDDYELQAAALNSMLAAFITTPLDEDVMNDENNDISAYAKSEMQYYGEQPIDIDGVQVGFLHPGNKVETVKAEHPSANFESFERNALRNIASAAGMSYEALTADFSQANYSSIRAALVEFRKGYAARRVTIGSHWQSQLYRCWLEEIFDRQLVEVPAGAPSFEAAPSAWSNARWITSASGWVDPKREAEAAGMRMSTNISTLEDEIAADGGDWKERIDQRARERAYMIKNGIDPDAGRLEARIQSSIAPSDTSQEEDDDHPDKRDEKENRRIAAVQSKRSNRVSVPQIPFNKK